MCILGRNICRRSYFQNNSYFGNKLTKSVLSIIEINGFNDFNGICIKTRYIDSSTVKKV